MTPLFTEQAKQRAKELGVAHQIKFLYGDAAGHVADEKADVAACVGATWVGAGIAGTLRTGGIMLIGVLLAEIAANRRDDQGVSCQLNIRFSQPSKAFDVTYLSDWNRIFRIFISKETEAKKNISVRIPPEVAIIIPILLSDVQSLQKEGSLGKKIVRNT